jgi:hypothetical protein
LVLILNVFALHFELVGLSEELIYDVVQLVKRYLSPLPGVTVVSKVFPGDFFWPALKAGLVVVVLNKRHLTDYCFVFLQSTHYSFQLILRDSFLVFVEFSIEWLYLILLPFDQSDL